MNKPLIFSICAKAFSVYFTALSKYPVCMEYATVTCEGKDTSKSLE